MFQYFWNITDIQQGVYLSFVLTKEGSKLTYDQKNCAFLNVVHSAVFPFLKELSFLQGIKQITVDIARFTQIVQIFIAVLKPLWSGLEVKKRNVNGQE